MSSVKWCICMHHFWPNLEDYTVLYRLQPQSALSSKEPVTLNNLEGSSGAESLRTLSYKKSSMIWLKSGKLK